MNDNHENKLKSFIIVGPEQTCSRYLKRMFIDAGCWGTRDTNRQDLDKWIGLRSKIDLATYTGDSKRHIVLHRSVPYGHTMPSLRDIGIIFNNAGYEPYFVIATREWFACCRSKTKRKSIIKTIEHAQDSLRHELIYIFSQLSYLNYYVVDMSLLQIAPGRVLCGLEQFTGLRFTFDNEGVLDADKKYYSIR